MEENLNSEPIQPMTEEEVKVKVEKSVKVFFKHAFKFGGIFSLIFIGLTLIYYIANINFFSNFAYMIISFLVNTTIIVIAFVMGINKYRDGILGGNINFGRCFFMGLTIGFFTFILSGIFSLIFNNLFDPGYITKQMTEMLQGLAEKGVPDEQIALIQEKMEANLKIGPQILGILSNSLIFSSVVSLIVSAFIRKKDKSFIEEGNI